MTRHTDPDRVRSLNDIPPDDGPVLYWMSRDVRAEDNWALIHAHEEATERGVALGVVFHLVPTYLGATRRHYAFLLDGLREVHSTLAERGIPLTVTTGEDPPEAIRRLVADHHVGLVVTDFNPLRPNRTWRESLAGDGSVAVHCVDAHNVVPVWEASDKQEYAARTIRPKIHRHLDRYLVDFPPPPAGSPGAWTDALPEPDWDAIEGSLNVREDIGPVDWITPGPNAARGKLGAFIAHGLDGYDDGRNDPNERAQSGLSPYFHFGHLAPQRAALAVQASGAPSDDVDAYIEELIVRRELSDNYCWYCSDYDKFEGFPDWAKKTLNEHRDDPREYVYASEDFEHAATHDPLWNAAQRQMVDHGKMHGYMRMYWAKKILEWTDSPESAQQIAIELNDRYELDGRDPNGYVGVAWSVGGVHDRAWQERPVYGKVRYMSYSGCRRKFDVDAYIRRWCPGADR